MAHLSTPLLDSLDSVKKLRALAHGQLRQLADELRAETIDAAEQYDDACLQARHIVETAVTALGVTKHIREVAARR